MPVVLGRWLPCGLGCIVLPLLGRVYRWIVCQCLLELRAVGERWKHG
jgi:hypothetical protein